MSEYKSFRDESQGDVVDSQNKSDSDEHIDESDLLDDEVLEESEPDTDEEAKKTEGVAEPEQGEDKEDENQEDKEDENQEDEEQSKEQNAIYRKMRLKAEQEARAILEAEKQKIEDARMELEIARQEREANQVETNVRSQILTEENINNVEIGKGVTREIAIQLLEADAQKVITDERNKVKERHRVINEQKKNFKSDPFYSLVVDKVDKIISENSNVDFDTAYSYYVGKNYKQLNEQLSKNDNKKRNADIQDRRKRRVIKSDGETGNRNKPLLTDRGRNMAEAFGNDPSKIAARIKKNKSK